MDVDDEVEDRWGLMRTEAEAAAATNKRVASQLTKLLSAVDEGGLGSARKAVAEIREAVAALGGRLESIAAELGEIGQQLSSPDSLSRAVETLLAGKTGDRRVWRSGPELVVYPIVTVIDRGNGDVATAKVRVGKKVVKTQRPSVVVDQILEALEANHRSDKFARALYRAFKLLHRDQEFGRDELANLYEVLATAPPDGTVYSWSDFGSDLQQLHASGTCEAAPGVVLTLERAVAASNGVRIVLPTGDSVPLGWVVFEAVKGEPNG